MSTSARIPNGSKRSSKQSIRKVPGPIKKKHGVLSRLRDQMGVRSKEFLAFIPGTLCLAMAISLLFAPTLFTAIVAGFFLFVGALGIYGGWRALQVIRKVQSMAKTIEARIFIQGINESEPEIETESNSSKKIVFH